MKTRKLFLALILLSGWFCVFSQDDLNNPVKRFQVNEFYILPAFLRLQQTYATADEFKSLAPASILLNRDLTGLSSSQSILYNPSGSLSILIGLKLRNKERTAYRKSPSVRIGITCLSSSVLNAGLYGQSKAGSDTLVSAQSGKAIYIDSLNSRQYNMDYRAQQLRLDCSLIFRTDPAMRWGLFAGIGLNGGYSINTNTTISYSQSKWIRYGSDDSGYDNHQFFFPTRYTSDYISEREQLRGKNSFAMSAYVPIGVDFRVGKKHSFWKMVHAFIELRPGVNFTFVSELHTFASTSMQHGLGLKMAW